MKLRLHWHHAVALRKASESEGLSWVCDGVESIPDLPGCYVFARCHGADVNPIYIGKSMNIRRRVESHFAGSVRLMNAITNAKNGRRVVLACELLAQRGQRADVALKILERSLIRYAVFNGADLVNIKGTRIPVAHEIDFTGSRDGLRMFGKGLYISG